MNFVIRCTSLNISSPLYTLTARRFPLPRSFIWRRSFTASSKSNKSHVTSILSPRIIIPGVGVLLGTIAYYRWRKSSELLPTSSFPDEVFETPFIDGSTKFIIRYQNAWFPKSLFANQKSFQEIEEFKLNDDDIVVVSFPKSGTTWLQQIVWLILADVAESPDRLYRTMEDKFPYLEYPYPGIKELAKWQSPRFIKTHLPYEFLPRDVHSGKAKVLYIARNVKDVCVSYYHFHRMLSLVKYRGTFDDFLDLFLSGRVSYGPWPNHVQGFWEHRDDKNILFIQYEDLKKDPAEVIREVAMFLGRSLTDQRVNEIIKQSSFMAMQENPSVNYGWWDNLGLRVKDEAQFLRKGVVGDWKNYFTADTESLIHKTCLETLEQRGLVFADRLPTSGQQKNQQKNSLPKH